MMTTPTLDGWADQCWPILPVRPNTLKNYVSKYRKHISPVFGSMPIDTITRASIQRWALSLPGSVAKANLPILRSLIREALLSDHLDKNPCIGIRRPAHTPAERPFLPMEDVLALDCGRYTPVVRFLALHGLRWSEMRFLQAEDIEVDWVHVQRSADGYPPKNGKTRRVPYRGEWDESFSHAAYSRCRTALREAAGVGIHTLRATYANDLLRRGVPLNVAQRWLGHSSVEMTVGVYGKALPADLEAAARLLRPAEPLEHLATVECESCDFRARSDEHKAVSDHMRETGHRLHWS